MSSIPFNWKNIAVDSIERQKKLLGALRSVIIALDDSVGGPAVNILPRWQLDEILNLIEENERQIRTLSGIVDDK